MYQGQRTIEAKDVQKPLWDMDSFPGPAPDPCSSQEGQGGSSPHLRRRFSPLREQQGSRRQTGTLGQLLLVCQLHPSLNRLRQSLLRSPGALGTSIVAMHSTWGCPRKPPGNYQLVQKGMAQVAMGILRYVHRIVMPSTLGSHEAPRCDSSCWLLPQSPQNWDPCRWACSDRYLPFPSILRGRAQCRSLC